MKDAASISEPPFEPRPLARKPTVIGGAASEEIDREIQKGIDSANTEKLYTIDEEDNFLGGCMGYEIYNGRNRRNNRRR